MVSVSITPFVRPSRHYHPSSYRLITATSDYSIGTTFRSKLLPVPPWSSLIKQSARLIMFHHRKSPYFYV